MRPAGRLAGSTSTNRPLSGARGVGRLDGCGWLRQSERSAGGPVQLAAAEYVQMQMIDCLTGI